MLKLYHSPESRSTRVIWLLEELGADYEIEYVQIQRRDGSGGPDPANPHPLKQVPALEHQGAVITESVVLFDHLCDLHPDAGLAPALHDPKRSEFVAWMGLYNSVLEPVVTAKFTSPEGLRPVQQQAYDALVEAIRAPLARGAFLMGETFTAADIIFGNVAIFFRNALPQDAAIDAWIERLKARPALARAMQKDHPPAQ